MISDDELKKSAQEGGDITFIPPDLSAHDARTLRLALHLSHSLNQYEEDGDPGVGNVWQTLIEHLRLKGRLLEDRRMILTGIKLLRFDFLNQKKRIYPRFVIENIIDNYQERRICGYLISATHQPLAEVDVAQYTAQHFGATLDVQDICHEVFNFRIEEDWLVADVNIFDSFYGQQFQRICRSQGQVLFRPISTIFSSYHSDGKEVVNNCQFKRIDVITDVNVIPRFSVKNF